MTADNKPKTFDEMMETIRRFPIKKYTFAPPPYEEWQPGTPSGSTEGG